MDLHELTPGGEMDAMWAAFDKAGFPRVCEVVGYRHSEGNRHSIRVQFFSDDSQETVIVTTEE